MIPSLGPQTYSEPIGLNSTIILSNTSLDSINPQFSVSDNTIYAVWISNLNHKNSEVLFKKVDNNSMSFSATVNISNTTGISNLVKLSSTEDNVYIIWEDKQADKWQLLFGKSDNKGVKFDSVTNLSNETGNVHLHDLSSAGNNVFVLWAANENISSSNKEIFFRKSNDSGDSFSDVLNLSNDIDDSLDPHMVINQNGSIIYIVWTTCDTKHDDPTCNIAFTQSLDQGNTFTTSKIINSNKFLPQRSNSTSLSDTVFSSNSKTIPLHLLNNLTVNEEISSINPTVFTTLEGNQVYVLWEQSTFGKGDSELFLTSSNDYGNSFNSTINISNSSGTSRFAHGHILGKELYVTWADTLNQGGTFDVLLRKIDPKNQLSKVLNLSNTPGNSVSPYLWIGDNKIHVVWTDNTNDSSVLLSTIDLSGSTVTKKILKSDPTDVYTNPTIFDTEDKLWIAWTESNKDVNKIVLVNQEKT
ncbi:MAG TPA: hypothetical protein VE548_12045 [Nitrososphaeraceae archaeon]|nr:hypothetical protein [Nitrososphaeraceae archaeon]